MDLRWIIDSHEDGPVEAIVLPDAHIMLHRAMWVHDGIELDRDAHTAMHRSQGNLTSDNPQEWPSVPFPLRREADRWQTTVTEADRERWIREQKASIENRRKFAVVAPGRIADEGIDEAVRRLALIEAITPGWVDLAEDLSAALDRELGGPQL